MQRILFFHYSIFIIVCLNAFSSEKIHSHNYKNSNIKYFHFTGSPLDPVQIRDKRYWIQQVNNHSSGGADFWGISFDTKIAPEGYDYSLTFDNKPNQTVLDKVSTNGITLAHGTNIYIKSKNQFITVYREAIE